jgi:mRNA interferase RelE/StbE
VKLPYRVLFYPAAERQLAKLSAGPRQRVLDRVARLAADPRPRGSVKLAGALELHRVRVGDYRVIYEIRDDEVLVLVVAIGHRREVYR